MTPPVGHTFIEHASNTTYLSFFNSSDAY